MSGKCQGISECLESGHPGCNLMNVYNLLVTVSTSESIDVCFCLAAPAAAAAAAAAPDLIIPKTPKLVSKSRTRKITARSHADVEQDQLEEMKK